MSTHSVEDGRHARNTVPVGLLCRPPESVAITAACEGERGQVEIPERLDHHDRGWYLDRLLGERVLRPRVSGQHRQLQRSPRTSFSVLFQLLAQAPGVSVLDDPARRSTRWRSTPTARTTCSSGASAATPATSARWTCGPSRTTSARARPPTPSDGRVLHERGMIAPRARGHRRPRAGAPPLRVGGGAPGGLRLGVVGRRWRQVLGARGTGPF